MEFTIIGRHIRATIGEAVIENQYRVNTVESRSKMMRAFGRISLTCRFVQIMYAHHISNAAKRMLPVRAITVKADLLINFNLPAIRWSYGLLL